MTSVEPERQCGCDKPIEEKKLVKYDFGSGGIQFILVCSSCLEKSPFNKCIEVIHAWQPQHNESKCNLCGNMIYWKNSMPYTDNGHTIIHDCNVEWGKTNV